MSSADHPRARSARRACGYARAIRTAKLNRGAIVAALRHLQASPQSQDEREVAKALKVGQSHGHPLGARAGRHLPVAELAAGGTVDLLQRLVIVYPAERAERNLVGFLFPPSELRRLFRTQMSKPFRRKGPVVEQGGVAGSSITQIGQEMVLQGGRRFPCRLER